MESILVDTSVWIDWFNEKSNYSPETNLLGTYFTQRVPVYATPTILQEVLQGIRSDKDFRDVREVLLSVPILLLDPVEAAIEAATLYRSLRQKGVTIRKPNDCLIAHYAIFYGVPVLHNDIDFDQIARFTTLRIANP
ncbi:PIN domain nuclease [Spirosoma soli]|uniref:Ribonuclease VapC n=1 Tax=Spirosoma soli TaxID=1770529 RepID=A0ABW5M8G6_9BACT